MKKIINIILCLSLLGCTASLKDDTDIETSLQQLFPYMTIENIETDIYNDEYDYKKYTINNQGITFTYENYQSADTLFGGTTTNSKNNYCARLYECFYDEIDDISLNNNMTIESANNTINITNNISDTNEIEQGLNAFNHLYQTIEYYLPQTTLSFSSLLDFLTTKRGFTSLL